MNIMDFKASLDYLVKAELTPFIWGHAGIGKSSIVKQYAKEKGYHFFPFYLGTQSDLGDILGLADFVRDENGTAVATTFATPIWLKNTIDYCNQNPDSGAVIFLDEFNRARKDILNGMFSLALDKTFHTIRLPKNCHIIAAGNPPTDEYFTTDVNETALMARFVHVKLEPSFDEWIQYAKSQELDTNLIDFIRQQPELLEETRSDFELPVKVDRRSWERLNRLIALKTPGNLVKQLMPGIVGITRTVAYDNYLAASVEDRPLAGDDVLKGIGMDRVKRWSDPTNIISSILNITCGNVETTLIAMNQAGCLLEPMQKVNLMAFIEACPKDVVYPFIKGQVQSRSALFKDFYLDPLYEKPMITIIANAKGEAKK